MAADQKEKDMRFRKKGALEGRVKAVPRVMVKGAPEMRAAQSPGEQSRAGHEALREERGSAREWLRHVTVWRGGLPNWGNFGYIYDKQ